MKVVTPEISWHGKDAVFSIDVQPVIYGQTRRLATGGLDNNVRIWQLKEEVKFLSNLSRHDKAVNVVRFSRSGILLASAGDDGTIILWKLSDKEEIIPVFDDEEGKNIETWNAFKVLRGHLEDINDLYWSYDDLNLISGSVDHTAILWDIEKGQKLVILSDAKHFVNGVAWDPLGQYVATMSCDRSLRIYNIQTKKMVHCVNKLTNKNSESKSDSQQQKSQRIFHDETVVRRRLSFTVDGKMLITPAGCLQVNGNTQQVNTAMIFGRNNLSKPCAYLPGLQEPACIVVCCPTLFELRNTANTKAPSFKLEYRHIFAVASVDTVLMYDTQQTTPFAMISNIHYSSITDLSWSPDASFLVVSSRDGFCSIIFFEDDELGTPYKASVDSTEKQGLDHEAVERPEKNDHVIELNAEKEAMNVEMTTTKVTECDEIRHALKEVESMTTDETSGPACLSECETQKIQLDQEADKNNSLSSSPKVRRVVLTTISSSQQLSAPKISPVESKKTPLATKKSDKFTTDKKATPRRIQLTPVSLNQQNI